MKLKTCPCGNRYVKAGSTCPACRTTPCAACGRPVKGARTGRCRRCTSVAAAEASRAAGAAREPTMAELDALVAERMKNLPAWWEHATACTVGARPEPRGKATTTKVYTAARRRGNYDAA